MVMPYRTGGKLLSAATGIRAKPFPNATPAKNRGKMNPPRKPDSTVKQMVSSLAKPMSRKSHHVYSPCANMLELGMLQNRDASPEFKQHSKQMVSVHLKDFNRYHYLWSSHRCSLSLSGAAGIVKLAGYCCQN